MKVVAPRLVEAVRHLAVLNVGKVKEKLQEQEDFYAKVANEIFKPNPEFDAARKAATLALLGLLSQLIEKNPTMRFSQILQNYGFVKPNRPAHPDQRIDWQNEFYMEPVALLKRVQDRINDIENPEG